LHLFGQSGMSRRRTKNKLKILFLVSSLGPGGAERVATTLCNAWAARGDSVTLAPTSSGGGQPLNVGKSIENYKEKNESTRN
jgi:hypothetical protein